MTRGVSPILPYVYIIGMYELNRAGVPGILFVEMIIDPNFLYFITETIENQLNNKHLSKISDHLECIDIAGFSLQVYPIYNIIYWTVINGASVK